MEQGFGHRPRVVRLFLFFFPASLPRALLESDLLNRDRFCQAPLVAKAVVTPSTSCYCPVFLYVLEGHCLSTDISGSSRQSSLFRDHQRDAALQIRENTVLYRGLWRQGPGKLYKLSVILSIFLSSSLGWFDVIQICSRSSGREKTVRRSQEWLDYCRDGL